MCKQYINRYYIKKVRIYEFISKNIDIMFYNLYQFSDFIIDKYLKLNYI